MTTTKMMATSSIKSLIYEQSFEEFFTTPHIGLGCTTATNIQRAVCRLIDGSPLGDLWADPDVREAFGEIEPNLTKRPSEIFLYCAARAGKSKIIGAAAWWLGMTADLSMLAPTDLPRVAIVSLKKDLADVIFNDHIANHIKLNPILAETIELGPNGNPIRSNKDGSQSIYVKNKSGRLVEIVISAGAAAGGTLVSRWFVSVIFDEAARMNSAAGYKVNFEHSYSAVAARIIPGGVIFTATSPWQGLGPVHEKFEKTFGNPTAECVTLNAPGWTMNPYVWTAEKCEMLKNKDYGTWLTDCAAKPRTPEEALINATILDRQTRMDEGLAPVPGMSYVAAMDPASKRDKWGLVIVAREGQRRDVVLVREWSGNTEEPLRPGAVMREIAEVLKPYNIDNIYTDQHMADALVDLGELAGVTVTPIVWTQERKKTFALNIRNKLAEGWLTVPRHEMLRHDMLTVKLRFMTTTSTVFYPNMNGRHCDLFSSLSLAIHKSYEDFEAQQAHEETPAEREERLLEEHSLKEMNNDEENAWIDDEPNYVDF